MRLRVIDAFADRPFTGNPAAVCLLDANTWPDEQWMQKVASEMNLSQTAFALSRASRKADWQLRWFTPVMEDDLCGHATLATAHALRQDARIESHVRFFTRSGVLTAALGDDGSITLDFPAADLAALPVPEGLAVALGAAPDGAMFSGSLRDAIAVFATEREVRDLLPDLHAVATLTRRGRIRGITATAPADTDADYDFVSRFFSPADGIPEDPVCGSAHTALGPYWASRLGRSDLVGFQASRRGGIVRTRVDGDRVKLTGCAVTVLDATLAGTSPEVGVCRSAHG